MSLERIGLDTRGAAVRLVIGVRMRLWDRVARK